MQATKFNVRVPLPNRDELFLMNTFTDAQLIVPGEVADLLDRLDDAPSTSVRSTGDEREVIDLLVEHGFLVESHERERADFERYFRRVREDASDMRVTVLTTMQCNFACDYCFQGDHGGPGSAVDKMSLETTAKVGGWIAERLRELRPKRIGLMFFGGEPLLNQPAMYALADQTWTACRDLGITMYVDLITNGLLLTPDVVARLKPYGLNGIKVTLDGDRATHDRMRPMRGGQGTFDRIIENVRRVADQVDVTIGGNFDESSVDSYPALLDFLKEQAFADKLAKVSFKPIIKTAPAPQPTAPGVIPLRPVTSDGQLDQAASGACMTSVGSGGSPCDTCHFVEDSAAFLREETERHGFPTPDGVHMGPCEIHRRHAYTIGPDGSLYACPGFTGEPTQSTGHIDGRAESARQQAAERFERLAAWRSCGECAFIPVCAGGCSVASHVELGDMDAPTCHKASFETALIGLADRAAKQEDNYL